MNANWEVTWRIVSSGAHWSDEKFLSHLIPRTLVYICICITPLKTKTKNYEVANHVLVTHKEETGHVHAAEQKVAIRLGIVQRES